MKSGFGGGPSVGGGPGARAPSAPLKSGPDPVLDLLTPEGWKAELT